MSTEKVWERMIPWRYSVRRWPRPAPGDVDATQMALGQEEMERGVEGGGQVLALKLGAADDCGGVKEDSRGDEAEELMDALTASDQERLGGKRLGEYGSAE